MLHSLHTAEDESNMTTSTSTTSASTPATGTSSSSSSPTTTTTSRAWWYSSYVIPLYIGWRILWANRLPSLDCDEVYNYWEPLHFILYGTGYQTWEYGHDYGLRTYAYLLPLAGWARMWQTILAMSPSTSSSIISLLVPFHGWPDHSDGTMYTSKLVLFCILRASLAAASAVAELAFCRALEQRLVPNQTTVATVTLWLLLTSAGMAHASSAFLPSSTLMILWMVSATCYLQQQHRAFCVVAIVATLAVGWPFGVVLFVPMGLDVLYQTWQQDRHSLQPVSAMSQLIRFISITTLVIQAVVMCIDYYFYGRWLSPIWNILQYNASGGGDALYGVEPLSYYIKNVFLNFNYMGFVAMLALPFWYLSARSQPNPRTAIPHLVQQQQMQWRIVLVGLLLPLYLWLWLVVPRPHKEERFLYPIYPLLCFGAALTVDVVLDGLAIRFFRLAQAPAFAKWAVQSAVCFPSTLLSALRILALSKYYQAPMILYATLNAHVMSSSTSTSTLVCTCGEWYRFPSTFMLPHNMTLGFLPSSFRGQLPQPFTIHGSRQESPLVFNDRNLEETASYILDSGSCQYLVTLQYEDCGELQRNNNNNKGWSKVAQSSLLNSQRTRSTLHRAFYVPLFHQRAIQSGHVYYDNYILYERNKKQQP